MTFARIVVALGDATSHDNASGRWAAIWPTQIVIGLVGLAIAGSRLVDVATSVRWYAPYRTGRALVGPAHVPAEAA